MTKSQEQVRRMIEKRLAKTGDRVIWEAIVISGEFLDSIKKAKMLLEHGKADSALEILNHATSE